MNDVNRAFFNFDLGKNKIYHYIWEEHLKISKIAKFGDEML